MQKVVDISLRLGRGYIHNTPEGVENVQLAFDVIKDYPGGLGQQVRAVRMRLHHGTHVDAPMHFVPGGKGISDFPLETFCGPVVLVDLTSVGENEAISAGLLEKQVGDAEVEGQRVLLRTDWNHHYGEADYDARAPYIGPDAVDWIVQRKPALVGYDYAHSKDAPDSPRTVYALRGFLENDIIPMGYVRNLDKIDPTKNLTLVAAPLAFEAVEASPVRAVVVEQ